MEGTQEGQTSYLSGDVPVECVRLMTVSLPATRGPGTVCTGAQREPARVEPPGLPQSQEGSQPYSPSWNQIQFTCPLCPREKAYQGTAASVAAHQREAHPGEGNNFLEKLGTPLQKTRRSNRYGVSYKSGDLHTNLSRHSSGCGRTPSDTIPPHFDGLGGEPFARNPDTPSTPAAETFNQSEQFCYEPLERLIGISHKHWNHGKINGGQKRHYPFRHPKWRYPYQERCELPDPPLVISLSFSSPDPQQQQLS